MLDDFILEIVDGIAIEKINMTSNNKRNSGI